MSLIDEYFKETSGPEKDELMRIRSLVQKTVPDAEEVITYSMPGFKYKGKYLVAFCIFKDHLGLFPTSWPIEKLKDKLSGYKTSKGGIQFSLDNPLSDQLIKEILYARISEIDHK